MTPPSPWTFQHHGADGAIQKGPDAFQVPGFGVEEALCQGKEILVEPFLPGGSQGGEGAAVEGVVQSDDLVSAPLLAVLAGYLDSALVGLGAGVAEKGFRHAGGLGELLGQGGVLRAVVVVAQVLDGARLARHSLDPLRVAVSQGVDADACGEVDVFLAVHIPGPGVAPLDQGGVHPAIGGQDVSLVLRFDLFKSHRSHSQRDRIVNREAA